MGDVIGSAGGCCLAKCFPTLPVVVACPNRHLTQPSPACGSARHCLYQRPSRSGPSNGCLPRPDLMKRGGKCPLEVGRWMQSAADCNVDECLPKGRRQQGRKASVGDVAGDGVAPALLMWPGLVKILSAYRDQSHHRSVDTPLSYQSISTGNRLIKLCICHFYGCNCLNSLPKYRSTPPPHHPPPPPSSSLHPVSITWTSCKNTKQNNQTKWGEILDLCSGAVSVRALKHARAEQNVP